MTWITRILALLQLVPELIKVVVAVQAAVGSGNGEAKKALVMATLTTAPTDVQTMASSYVDTYVTETNKIAVAEPAK